tara:strand:- start:1834 stop:2478 length:645 start_codon:yes stop_codon:yes gene_type:complete
MDEEISIINTNSRIERIKNFFAKNKKIITIFISTTILIIFSFFILKELDHRKNKNIADQYNEIIINFETSNKNNFKNQLIEIINEKNSTYSPLALYFIIDNKIDTSNEELNRFFDLIINETDLDEEIKNLIIYKKGLFNSDFETENNLIMILNPLISSDSVWKSHALYLIAEYFFDKNQKQKAKEFYDQILKYEKSNENIVKETQKRLSRDFSE